MNNQNMETKNYRKPKIIKRPVTMFIIGIFIGAIFAMVFFCAIGVAKQKAPETSQTTINSVMTSTSSSMVVTMTTQTEIITPSAKESIGLAYNVTSDNTCEIAGMGTCADSELIIPTYIDGYKVTRIGAYAFYESNNLKSVTIPDGVTAIGENAFYECGNLSNISIPNSVTSIGGSAFYGTNLNDIIIPDNIAIIESWVFAYTPLTSVVIHENITSIGYAAFQGCDELTNITFSDSVTSISGAAFSDCTSLTNVTLGNGVTSVGVSAFLHCTNLTSVVIPAGVKSIGKYAFSDCANLTSIIVDENNTTYMSINGDLYSKDGTALLQCSLGKIGTSFDIRDNVTTIGDGAFYGCKSLTNITITEGVTSIGERAFYECINLMNITIPESTTSIGSNAFYKCREFIVYYKGDVRQWNKIDIGDFNDDLKSGNIYYYSESQPTDTIYYYWHYINDVPMVWD
jgi:hypothetical protein